MDTNTTLGSAGAGNLVESLGQEWAVMPPTQKSKSGFIAWMKLEATKQLLAEQPYLPASYFAEKEKRLIAYQGSGDFEWGEPLFKIFVNGEAGAERLVWILLAQKHPDISLQTVKAIKADNPKGLAWAFRAALAAADPSLFSPPETPEAGGEPKARPERVRPIPMDGPSTQSGLASPSPISTSQMDETKSH